MPSILGPVKVLVSKHNMQDYRGARVKRITVTVIEYISSNGRCLNPMIIWLASTYEAIGPRSLLLDSSMHAPTLDILTLKLA
jgi:hypothetical protein